MLIGQDLVGKVGFNNSTVYRDTQYANFFFFLIHGSLLNVKITVKTTEHSKKK